MTYEYPDYIKTDCAMAEITCLGSSGRIGLWIAFGCMFVPMLIFWFKAASKPAGQRKFEYLSKAIKVAKGKIADASAAVQSQTESIGEDSAELAEVKKNLKADKDYLRSLTLDCIEAKDAWGTRQ